MKYQGDIQKMKVELNDSDGSVSYHLPIGDDLVCMNDFIGNEISLSYQGEIHCISCGRKTKKSFSQGHCFPCMQSLPECDSCIIKPELCHYHEGTCRDAAWGEQHCLQDHYVYLSNTSGVKVGITRHTNIPSRWIDQGATQALPIFKVKDRITSGKVEVIFKDHVADKTAWQRMLKGSPDARDLKSEFDNLLSLCSENITALQKELGEDAVTILSDAEPVEINYPVEQYPEKVKSLNFDKVPDIKGVLKGIKGQYLLLDIGVLNIRKFAGYKIALTLT